MTIALDLRRQTSPRSMVRACSAMTSRPAARGEARIQHGAAAEEPGIHGTNCGQAARAWSPLRRVKLCLGSRARQRHGLWLAVTRYAHPGFETRRQPAAGVIGAVDDADQQLRLTREGWSHQAAKQRPASRTWTNGMQDQECPIKPQEDVSGQVDGLNGKLLQQPVAGLDAESIRIISMTRAPV